MTNPKTQPDLLGFSAHDLWMGLFLGLVFLTPILSSGTAAFSGILDQNFWLVGVNIAFAILILIFRPHRQFAFKFTYLDWLPIIWLGWLLISTIFSVNIVDSWFGSLIRSGSWLHWLGMTLLYFNLRVMLPQISYWWKNLMVAIVYSGVAVAILSLVKFLVGTQQSNELIGLLGNQNFTAYFLCLTAITTYYLWLKNREKIFDYFLLALMVQAIAIWLANALWAIAMLGLVAIGIYLVLLKQGAILRLKSRLVGILLIVAFLSGIVIVALNLGLYAAPFNRSVQNRLAAWEIGLQASFDRPLTGYGLENFDSALQNHFAPRFEDQHGVVESFDRPHNFIVEYLVTTGFVGLIIFLWWLVWSWRLAWTKRTDTVALWALSIITIYPLLNLLGFEMLATTAIFVMALAYIGSLAPVATHLPPWLVATVAKLRWGWAAFLLVWLLWFVIMPFTAYQVAWRALLKNDLERFDTALVNASYLKPDLSKFFMSNHYSPQFGTKPFYVELGNYLQNQIAHRTNDASYQLAIAKAWQLSDDSQRLEKMKQALVRGSALYDDRNGYYWVFIADVELAQKNYDAALTAITTARELNPQSVFTQDAYEQAIEQIELFGGQ